MKQGYQPKPDGMTPRLPKTGDGVNRPMSYMEWNYHREAFTLAHKIHASDDRNRIYQTEPMVKPSKLARIRRWFFTPRGALVYFGIGYAALAAWLILS